MPQQADFRHAVALLGLDNHRPRNMVAAEMALETAWRRQLTILVELMSVMLIAGPLGRQSDLLAPLFRLPLLFGYLCGAQDAKLSALADSGSRA